MKTRFLEVCNIIEDIISFRDFDEVDETYVKKMISEFARKIETDEQLVHRVALVEVKDHVVECPSDLSSILQVCYRGQNNHPIVKGQVTKWVHEVLDGSDCKYNITLDCPECHQEKCDHRDSLVTIDVDDIWRQQHPEYSYMHMNHMYRWGGMNKENIPLLCSPYNNEFHIIKYAQHNFHNANYHIGGCMNLDERLMSNVTTEYTISNGLIKLNREGGDLLIAYMGQLIDKKGYHMVPDLPEVIEGIKWYFEELMSWKAYRKNKDKHDLNAFNIAKAERHRLQRVINEKLQTPSYTAWMSFLSNRWKRTINDNNYFGHMNKNAPDYYDQTMSILTRK